MSQPFNQNIRLRVDDKLFMISPNSLKKYPDCAFAKVLYKKGSFDFIIPDPDNSVLYVDMSPDSLSVIVDYLRGYPIHPCDYYSPQIVEKIHYDAKRLELNELANIFEEYLPRCSTVESVTKYVASTASSLYEYVTRGLDFPKINFEEILEDFLKDKTNMNNFKRLIEISSRKLYSYPSINVIFGIASAVICSYYKAMIPKIHVEYEVPDDTIPLIPSHVPKKNMFSTSNYTQFADYTKKLFENIDKRSDNAKKSYVTNNQSSSQQKNIFDPSKLYDPQTDDINNTPKLMEFEKNLQMPCCFKKESFASKNKSNFSQPNQQIFNNTDRTKKNYKSRIITFDIQ